MVFCSEMSRRAIYGFGRSVKWRVEKEWLTNETDPFGAYLDCLVSRWGRWNVVLSRVDLLQDRVTFLLGEEESAEHKQEPQH